MSVFARMVTILISSSVLAVMIGLVICFVVVTKVNRDLASADTDSAGFSGSAPTGDLRLVADRLQEVVNLLRK